jgi:hypothetical protein
LKRNKGRRVFCVVAFDRDKFGQQTFAITLVPLPPKTVRLLIFSSYGPVDSLEPYDTHPAGIPGSP